MIRSIPDRRAGWTLIETMVAIGIVGILIAMVTPALRAARERSGEVASLSNARQIAVSVDLYLGEHADVYPYPRVGEAYRVSFDGLIRLAPGTRWQMSTLWAAVMRESAPWSEHAPAWISPGADIDIARGGVFVPSYRFSNSFVADGRLWSELAAQSPPESLGQYLREVKKAQVAHPSSKALIWDQDVAYRRRPALFNGLPNAPLPIAFADGHGAVHPAHEASPPVTNLLNPDWWRDSPLHNTRDGVLGRDY